MEKLFGYIIGFAFNFLLISQTNGQYDQGGGGGGGCNGIELSIQQMCELVPDTGDGRQDIIRIYYNPVLQQCLPFSWSGRGGNANRFISIKNCYEICHPADPGPRRLIASGIQTYLVKRKPPRYCNGKLSAIPELGIPERDVPRDRSRFGQLDDNDREQNKAPTDVIVRQIKNPYDPTKMLTIVQPVSYIKKGDHKLEIERRPMPGQYPSGRSDLRYNRFTYT